MESKKLFYPIGEVARMFDLPITTIRFWENNFSILKPKKTKKGNRLFMEQDIENLKLIYRLVKEEGYTLPGAEARIKEIKNNISTNEPIIQKLLQIRKELETLKEDL